MRKHVTELAADEPSIVTDRLFAAMRESGMELAAAGNSPGEHG